MPVRAQVSEAWEKESEHEAYSFNQSARALGIDLHMCYHKPNQSKYLFCTDMHGIVFSLRKDTQKYKEGTVPACF